MGNRHGAVTLNKFHIYYYLVVPPVKYVLLYYKANIILKHVYVRNRYNTKFGQKI